MILRATIAMSRPGLREGYDEVTFDLQCADGVRIVSGEIFEIVSPGVKSVKARPIISSQIVNRSDGITTCRMIGENSRHGFTTVVSRLRSMPNVSNISTSYHPSLLR